MSMKDYADRISHTILDQEAAIGADWLAQLEALSVRSNAAAREQLR